MRKILASFLSLGLAAPAGAAPMATTRAPSRIGPVSAPMAPPAGAERGPAGLSPIDLLGGVTPEGARLLSARDDGASALPAGLDLQGGAAGPAAAALEALRPEAETPLPVNRVAQALRALEGDPRAGRAMPGMAALGSRVEAPSSDASPAEQSGQASEHFAAKTGRQDSERLPPLDEGAAAGVGAPDSGAGAEGADADAAKGGRGGGKGNGRGRGRGRGRGDDEPPAPPKYPSRDLEFNGKTFPSVAFRPDRPIEPLIVQAIDAAKDSIVVTLYEFKSQAILKALRAAKARGVKIQMVVDFDNLYPVKQEGGSYVPHRSFELQALLNEGFDVTVLRGMWRYGINHNKFAVFDGKFGLFGSYNWSYTAERNHYENLVFTDEAERLAAMTEYWKYLRSLSVSFEEAKTKVWPKSVPAPPAQARPSIHFNGVDLPAWLYSPGQAEDAFVKAIDAAKKTIDVSMFTFRSTKIAEALLRAKKRKVKVRVLMDQSQAGQPYMKPYADWLAFNGIPVKINSGPNPDGPEYAEKNHNKFMVLDGALVETGSMNWTTNAFLMNFENANFLNDPVDASAYAQFFDDMFRDRRARKVAAPDEEPALPTQQHLEDDLKVEPKPLPPPKEWPALPDPGSVSFNGTAFPKAAVRPQHPVKDLLVKAIEASKKSIHLALFEFNLPEVLEALRDAKSRGLEVRLVLDYSHVFPKGLDHTGQERQRSAQIQALIAEGFDIRVIKGGGSYGTNHNKFAVFDGKMAEFGSYNWAETAENHHFESVMFRTEEARVAAYLEYWQWLYDRGLPVETVEEAVGAGKRVKWPKVGTAPVSADKPLHYNGHDLPLQAFSPQGLIEDTIISAIEAAKKTVQIAMFGFYSQPIADALLRAKRRNVNIQLVIDASQAKLMKLDDWFVDNDFDFKLVSGPDDFGNVMFEKNHHKYMVVDGLLVEMGSFNYSANAENNNFENANFDTDPLVAAFFAAVFRMLYDLGWRPFKSKRPAKAAPAGAEFFAAPTDPDTQSRHALAQALAFE